MPFDFAAMDNIQQHLLPEEPDQRIEIERKRDFVIGLVREGGISRSEAENIAREHKLGQLEKRAVWKHGDVFSFHSWSLEMALAWIVWRREDWVQYYFNDYRILCTQWVPLHSRSDLFFGSFDRRIPCKLVNILPATCVDVEKDALNAANPPVSKFADAKSDLWRHLSEGKLVASGFNQAQGKLGQIEAGEWLLLEPGKGRKQSSELVQTFEPNSDVYRAVCFLPAHITRIWTKDEGSKCEESTKPRRGRPGYSWDKGFKERLFELMDYHGGINADVDPSWRQKDLELEMREWIEENWDPKGGIGESTVRKYVAKYVSEWNEVDYLRRVTNYQN